MKLCHHYHRLCFAPNFAFFREVSFVSLKFRSFQPQSNKSMQFDERCAICLHDVIDDPAMLMPCYHCFCLGCINPWLERNATCPLCKRHPTHLIYNIESEEKFDKLALIDNEESSIGTVLPGDDIRISVYHDHMECQVDRAIHNVKFSPQYLAKNEAFIEKRIRDWIERDLRVVLRVATVELIVDVVYGLLQQIDVVHDYLEFEEQMREYIPDEFLCRQFVRELALFVQSNLPMKAYDQRAQYIQIISDDEDDHTEVPSMSDQM